MLKAFRGKCHHCGHDHDEEDAAPTPPASAPAKGRATDRILMHARSGLAILKFCAYDQRRPTLDELSAIRAYLEPVEAALVAAIGEGDGWVKCSERMPEEGIPVEVCNPRTTWRHVLAYRCAEGRDWWERTDGPEREVVIGVNRSAHQWAPLRPLPPPSEPKAKGDAP